MNRTNATYLIRFRARAVTELYYRDASGWVKVSARQRQFRATAEQVLNHLLPALAGLAPNLRVEVEHYAAPELRPLPKSHAAGAPGRPGIAARKGPPK